MPLNNFFDHIYCINLDKRTDKWAACQEEFARIGLTDVERFSAIDGRRVDVESNLLPGEVGIILSNLAVLRHAQSNKYEKILILEDDVQFSDTFVRDWNAWHKEIPDDWEMLYLGGNLVGWQPSPVSHHVHHGKNLFAIHALGLRSSTFSSMISAIDLNTPVDVTYGHQSHNFNSYLMVPRMAWQRPGRSDIQEQYVNYIFLHTGQWGIDS